MAFTDDDLRRFKACILTIQDTWKRYCADSDLKMDSLLARLEAAELITQRHNIEHHPASHDYEKDEKKCEECRELKAWLKSKGVTE